MEYNTWSPSLSCADCHFSCRTEPELHQHRILTGHTGTYNNVSAAKTYDQAVGIKKENPSSYRSRQPLHTPDGRLVGWKNISVGTEEQFNDSGNFEWTTQMSQGYTGSSFTAPLGELAIEDDKAKREPSRGQKRKSTMTRNGCPRCGCTSEGQCSSYRRPFSPYRKNDPSPSKRFAPAAENLQPLPPLDDLLSTETLDDEEETRHSITEPFGRILHNTE